MVVCERRERRCSLCTYLPVTHQVKVDEPTHGYGNFYCGKPAATKYVQLGTISLGLAIDVEMGPIHSVDGVDGDGHGSRYKFGLKARNVHSSRQKYLSTPRTKKQVHQKRCSVQNEPQPTKSSKYHYISQIL
jgi:hypothetical protein